jgi:hypothetical protein
MAKIQWEGLFMGLGILFNFDETDLAANRAGQLSVKQRKLRLDQVNAGHTAGIGFGIFLILVAVVGDVFLIPIGLRPQPGAVWALAGAVVLNLVFAGGGTYVLKMALPAPKLLGVFKSVTGPAEVTSVKSLGGGSGQPHHFTEYKLHVAGRKFDVERDPGSQIKPGAVYTTYFLEYPTGGLELLAVERVSKPT